MSLSMSECKVCNGYTEFIVYTGKASNSLDDIYTSILVGCNFCEKRGTIDEKLNTDSRAEFFKSQIKEEYSVYAYIRAFEPDNPSFRQYYLTVIQPAIQAGVKSKREYDKWHLEKNKSQ
jgi:hypothetical protein